VWGEGTEDLRCNVGKLISNDLTTADAYSKSAGKLVTDALAVTADMGSEVLTDGAGYTYIFPDSATDGEDRDIAAWTDGSGAAATWTEASDTSDDWSEQ